MTRRVGGPVSGAWRECVLTRATELVTLGDWTFQNHRSENIESLANAVKQHLDAAKEAACRKKPFSLWGRSSLVQRALGNLDAAEAMLLNFAPTTYIYGQMPSLLNPVQRHLAADDPRRQEFECIAQMLSVKDTDHTSVDERLADEIEEKRGRIVTAVRGASSAALREQLRVASFRNVLVATAVVMTLLAITVAVIGFIARLRSLVLPT
jgi:hypothetical protein